MTRTALLLLAAIIPASASQDWPRCNDMACAVAAVCACLDGDKAACAAAAQWHREACADDPDHEDCAVFRDEAAN